MHTQTCITCYIGSRISFYLLYLSFMQVLFLICRFPSFFCMSVRFSCKNRQNAVSGENAKPAAKRHFSSSILAEPAYLIQSCIHHKSVIAFVHYTVL